MDFTHHPVDWSKPGVSKTWDYLTPGEHEVLKYDFALVTCTKGHTCRLVTKIHSIAKDGTLSPSLVCPVPGCTFHEFVRLVGWNKENKT